MSKTEATLDLLGTRGNWRVLFDKWNDALIIVNADGEIAATNTSATRLFGYSGGELDGQSIELLIPQRFRLAHQQHRDGYANRARARPMGENLSLTAQRKDGTEFPVEISLNPLQTDAGLLVCAEVRDISLSQRGDALRQRAAQADAVAKFGELALTSTDLTQLKQQGCELLQRYLAVDYTLIVEPLGPEKPFLYTAGAGWPPGVVGQQLAPGQPNSLSRYCLHVAEPVIIDDLRTETRFEAPILRSFGVISGVACLIHGRDTSLGVIAAHHKTQRAFTHQDASFVRGIANTLGAAFERQAIAERLGQSQKLEALGQLTGGVAHDFNNLLTVISGNLQLLEDRATGDAAQTKMIQSATRAARRGADLTRKLLAFAQRQTLQPRAIDLANVVPTLAEMLRRTLGERVDVVVSIAPGTPLVRADPTSLETSVMNLAINARDAMPEGGVITIEVRPEALDEDYAARERDVQAGNYVLVAVTDTGSGMSRDVMAHVFEPFFTTKEKGKGTGLGLAMVYGFAKQSGGHVKIYSEPGNGTSVKLYLPPADALERQAMLGRLRELQGGNETILVVEDDNEVRKLAVQFCAGLGYRVLQAGDALSALAILEQTPHIDLLFTDIVLGSGQTGVHLAMQALQKYPRLKVLYTSGYARGALPMRGELGGEMELLHKPYRREQLAEKLRAVLERT